MKEMREKSLALHQIVLKLTGPVDPVGDTHIDDKRFENLQELTELLEDLTAVVQGIAIDNKDRAEYSMKRAGQHSHQCLLNLKRMYD